ncbi:hypothetical protein HDU76_012188 [Blyttiomyces sp. JEL0837]|nr:hypothetical protein HDU76_012188 [Blyttiomyces sp. JEL0837]
MLDAQMNPTISYLVSGAIGDSCASLLYVPSEVVKTRLQLQGRNNNPNSVFNRNYQGSIHAFQAILKKRGIRGLYHGWGATLLRDMPFTAIQFAVYENAKSFILHRYCDGDESRLTTFHDIISGGVAGILSGAVTTPLDVCKTYIMTQKRTKELSPRSSFVTIAEATQDPPIQQPANKPKAPAAHPAPEGIARQPAPYYSGVFQAFKGIYIRDGISGLFAGLVPRMVWTGCQSIIMFVVYENLLAASIDTYDSRDVKRVKWKSASLREFVSDR